MLQTVNNKVMLTDRSYSLGKKLVQVYIPATSSLYFGLSAIWGLPATEQVIGTLACVATFLGVCLGLSSNQYNSSNAAYDGQLVVIPHDDGSKMFSLELGDDPTVLETKKAITFKVKQAGPLNPPQGGT